MDVASSIRSEIKRSYLILGAAWGGINASYLVSLLFTMSLQSMLILGTWVIIFHQFIEGALELITGPFADRFGRTKSLAIGYGLMGLGGFLILLSTIVASGELSLALLNSGQASYLTGNTFVSGALDAWFVDSVGSKNAESSYLSRAFADFWIAFLGGVAIGGCLSIWFISYWIQLWLPWTLMAFLGFVGLLFISRRVCSESRQPIRIGVWSQIVQSCKHSFGVKATRYYILAFGSQYAVTALLMFCWITIAGHYLNFERIGKESFSFILVTTWMGLCFIRLISMVVVKKYLVSQFVSSTGFLIFVSLLVPVPILLFFGYSLFGETSTLPYLFILSIILARTFEIIISPLRSEKLNASILEPSFRATSLSLCNVSGCGFVVLSFLVFYAVFRFFPSTIVHFIDLISVSALLGLLGPLFYFLAAGVGTDPDTE